ncbi:MAG: TonB-dependent receptor [Parabacteroides sp.]|nr:TonB-dependent receptor [Parabacteroides sp.]
MKKFLTSIVIIFVTFSASSQTVVSGSVFNKNAKEPLSFSTVSVKNHNSGDFISGTITDEEGRFVISALPRGEYNLDFSFVGFKSEKRHIVVGSLNNVLDVGKIYLEESVTNLQEVAVTGRRQEIASALDIKTYSSENFIANSGGSVLDMMKSLPGVTIDQESKIILRGSDKVAVLVDGKQSSLTGFGTQQGLDNIPASMIESIEIINNPSAKYDASGMAGIVNIKFKESRNKRLNGDIGFVTGIGALSKRKEDLPTGMSSYTGNMRYTPSVNLNYKMEKLNIFLQSYLIQQKRLPNNEFSTRSYSTGDIVESQVAENRTQNHYNVKLGFDWNPTPDHTFTFFGLYDYEWHTDTTRIWYFQNYNYKDPIRKWSFNESEGTGFSNLTLQHKYKFIQPGHEINSQFAFTKGWEDESYNLYQDGPQPNYPVIHTDKTHVVAPEYVYLLTTDYTKPLPFGRIDMGIQGRLRHMPITYTMSKNPNNTALIYNYGDWSKWDERLSGVYLNLVSEFQWVDIEAGLRGEYASVKYNFAPNQYFTDDAYDYFDLFPNIRFTFKSKQNRFSLFFNRRIDRPGEDILRIFPKYDDPELLKIGNPSLRPQYTWNIETAYKHTWDTGSIFAAVYLKNTDSYYTRIYIQDPDNSEITIKAYDNLGRATNKGVELALDQLIAKTWNVSLNTNIYRNTIFAHDGIIYFPRENKYHIEKQSDTPWYVKLNNRCRLPKDFTVELNGVYFSPKNIGQGRELSRGGVDLGIKRVFTKNNLELNLSFTDIFNTMGIVQEINGEGFNVLYQNFYETQAFLLGIKYKF